MNYNILSIGNKAINDQTGPSNLVSLSNVAETNGHSDRSLKEQTYVGAVDENVATLDTLIEKPLNITHSLTQTHIALTFQDVRSHLHEHILVPRDYYERLPIGSEVRYITIDGTYHSGGYLKKYRNDNATVEICIENKRTGPSRNRTVWWVKLSQVKLLFKRINPSAVIEIQLIRRELAKKTQDLDEIRNELVIESEKRDDLETKFNFIVEQVKKQRLLIKELRDAVGIQTKK